MNAPLVRFAGWTATAATLWVVAFASIPIDGSDWPAIVVPIVVLAVAATLYAGIAVDDFLEEKRIDESIVERIRTL